MYYLSFDNRDIINNDILLLANIKKIKNLQNYMLLKTVIFIIGLNSVAIFGQIDKIYYSLDNALLNSQKVYKLDLSNQQIKELPNEIKTLENLTELILRSNELSDLPKTIKNLKNLKLLDLYDNNFRIISKEVTKINSLNLLYLNKNDVIKIRRSIKRLINLKEFDLIYNPNLSDKKIKKIERLLPNCKVYK